MRPPNGPNDIEPPNVLNELNVVERQTANLPTRYPPPVPNAHFINLGRMEYNACWEVQRGLARRLAAGEIPDTLLFVEHDPVLTLGAAFHEENLLLTKDEYEGRGIAVVRTDRGGDVTYHGPNQLVIYPIFHVKEHGGDLHKWLRDLEEAVIRLLARFDLDGYRFPPNTGVWMNSKKVAAIGIKVSKWVNIHGIALNCDNDLSPFDLIVPCGIPGYGVTSLTQEKGREVTIGDAMQEAVPAFEGVFGLEFEEVSLAKNREAGA
ncbi:MAG: lipoyl(octanoyl) transferase LipB [Armatimonadetes bacterium]|nr:lipoyl(octanoyl) transferase LipB [Armatimonadota bacterium]